MNWLNLVEITTLVDHSEAGDDLPMRLMPLITENRHSWYSRSLKMQFSMACRPDGKTHFDILPLLSCGCCKYY